MVLLVATQDTLGMTLSWICYKFPENPEAATGGGGRSLRSSWRENSRLQRHPGIHLSRPVDPRVPQVQWLLLFKGWWRAKSTSCMQDAAPRWRRAAWCSSTLRGSTETQNIIPTVFFSVYLTNPTATPSMQQEHLFGLCFRSSGLDWDEIGHAWCKGSSCEVLYFKLGFPTTRSHCFQSSPSTIQANIFYLWPPEQFFKNSQTWKQ